MKFRKKPVTIEAVQLRVVDINDDNQVDGPLFDEMPPWLAHAEEVLVRKRSGSDYAHVLIRTLEGDMLAEPGDWIIRGVKGELYPCNPDIFEATYEAAP